jgi:hypothetical protein
MNIFLLVSSILYASTIIQLVTQRLKALEALKRELNRVVTAACPTFVVREGINLLIPYQSFFFTIRPTLKLCPSDENGVISHEF